MSHRVMTLVYSRKVGSAIRKAILGYCADRSSDDGTGIWCSKGRIAEEVECSKRVVIETIRNFVDEGLLREVGKRRASNGFTVEYAMGLDAIAALPLSKYAVEPAKPAVDNSPSGVDSYPQGVTPRNRCKREPVTPRNPTGYVGSPQGVTQRNPNLPLTILEPFARADGRRAVGPQGELFANEASIRQDVHRWMRGGGNGIGRASLTPERLRAMADAGEVSWTDAERAIAIGEHAVGRWCAVDPTFAQSHLEEVSDDP